MIRFLRISQINSLSLCVTSKILIGMLRSHPLSCICTFILIYWYFVIQLLMTNSGCAERYIFFMYRKQIRFYHWVCWWPCKSLCGVCETDINIFKRPMKNILLYVLSQDCFFYVFSNTSTYPKFFQKFKKVILKFDRM
jgi:hypothetical protein